MALWRSDHIVDIESLNLSNVQIALYGCHVWSSSMYKQFLLPTTMVYDHQCSGLCSRPDCKRTVIHQTLPPLGCYKVDVSSDFLSIFLTSQGLESLLLTRLV